MVAGFKLSARRQDGYLFASPRDPLRSVRDNQSEVNHRLDQHDCAYKPRARLDDFASRALQSHFLFPPEHPRQCHW